MTANGDAFEHPTPKESLPSGNLAGFDTLDDLLKVVDEFVCVTLR